jgi:hypothetical protein
VAGAGHTPQGYSRSSQAPTSDNNYYVSASRHEPARFSSSDRPFISETGVIEAAASRQGWQQPENARLEAMASGFSQAVERGAGVLRWSRRVEVAC